MWASSRPTPSDYHTPLPRRPSSHNMPLSPREIKVILDLLDKGSLSLLEQKQRQSYIYREMLHWFFFFLPSFPWTSPPFSAFLWHSVFLFHWCLSVWQLCSSSWCSILLQGGRWFRRFMVTLTERNHVHPLLFFYFLVCFLFSTRADIPLIVCRSWLLAC